MKKKPAKQNKNLGHFEIISEKEVKYVEMQMDISPDLIKFLVKEGKKVAKKNPELYVQIGLRHIIETATIDEPTKVA